MPTPPATLYTKPGCVQCTATKRWLDSHGVEVTVIDVTTDPAYVDALRELGYQQVPVMLVETSTGTVHWGGNNPILLEAHFGAETIAA